MTVIIKSTQLLYTVVHCCSLQKTDELYKIIQSFFSKKALHNLITLDGGICPPVKLSEDYNVTDWQYCVVSDNKILQDSIFSNYRYARSVYYKYRHNANLLALSTGKIAAVKIPRCFAYIGCDLYDFSTGVSCINGMEPSSQIAHTNLDWYNRFGLIKNEIYATEIYNTLKNTFSCNPHIKAMQVVNLWRYGD